MRMHLCTLPRTQTPEGVGQPHDAPARPGKRIHICQTQHGPGGAQPRVWAGTRTKEPCVWARASLMVIVAITRGSSREACPGTGPLFR